jgi:hypothetical protein
MLGRNYEFERQRFFRLQRGERPQIEGGTVFHIAIKGEMWNEVHFIFDKQVAARHIGEPAIPDRDCLCYSDMEDGLQQIILSCATAQQCDQIWTETANTHAARSKLRRFRVDLKRWLENHLQTHKISSSVGASGRQQVAD